MKNPNLFWRDINTAPTDGTEVWVYTAPKYGLPEFECWCAYHPDAGWCTDELREVTHWSPGTNYNKGDMKMNIDVRFEEWFEDMTAATKDVQRIYVDAVLPTRDAARELRHAIQLIDSDVVFRTEYDQKDSQGRWVVETA